MNESVGSNKVVDMIYFSDLLCVWAYCAQIRLDEVRRNFGDQVRISLKFISVFGDVETKIGKGWADRGGFQGYNAHVQAVAGKFAHVEIVPDLWDRVRPASSAAPHLFMKAVQLIDARADAPGPAQASISERTAWALRRAFFAQGRDIALNSVRMEIAEELRLPRDAIQSAIDDGRAFAALCDDYGAQQRHAIEGSPTFLLNEGRQKLYGNINYRTIEANVQEVLRNDLSSGSRC